ncbi:hypothetical protein GCM10022267_83430 [Lentzea roselyniae]|uniref:Malonyl-CoA:ACP transacylase (MAT) domain-containing protein n=1 Tax=Lentzea roselyniae TaxID=531940 RepID=A0ABP7CAJ8_9PSEU
MSEQSSVPRPGIVGMASCAGSGTSIDQALCDAGLEPSARDRCAVVTVAGSPADTSSALVEAVNLLRRGDTDAAVIADADVALVLATEGRQVYAFLDALCSDDVSDPDTTAASVRSTLDEGEVAAGEVEYVLVTPTDTPAVVLSGLARVWDACDIGTAHTVLDVLPPGTGMLSALLRAADALHHTYLPAVSQVVVPQGSSFYLPKGSRPWLRADPSRPRRAVVSDAAGTFAVLTGAAVRGEVVQVDWDRAGGAFLLPVTGTGPADLLAALAEVSAELRRGTHPAALADENRLRQGHLRVVLSAGSGDALAAEADSARQRLSECHPRGQTWSTPAGSFFTPRPIGAGGKVALIYPGVLTAYPTVGADLVRCFPALMPWLESTLGVVPETAHRHHRRIYERGNRPTCQEKSARLLADLLADAPAAVSIAAAFACVQTEAVAGLLGVPVHGTVGCSLGEINALFATGRWSLADDGRLQDEVTRLYLERLGGPMHAVRERWSVPPSVPDTDLWLSIVVFAETSVVRELVGQYDRVFLTQINTPAEAVIAGDPQQCRQLVAKLDRPAMPSATRYVMHCPLVDPADLAPLLTRPQAAPARAPQLFSMVSYDTLTTIDPARLAAALATRTVDFPRLIRAAYAQGYRYFLEVGPGGTCTRWIGEILANSPHLAETLDRVDTVTTRTLGGVLAQLISHGVVAQPPAPLMWWREPVASAV